MSNDVFVFSPRAAASGAATMYSAVSALSAVRSTTYSRSALTAANWFDGSVHGVVVQATRLRFVAAPAASSSGKATYTLGSATSL